MRLPKLPSKQTVTYSALALFAVALFTVVLWEQVRDPFFALVQKDVEVVRVEKEPTTIDGLVEERAESWLKSAEALELAKDKVTEEVINELSKQ